MRSEKISAYQPRDRSKGRPRHGNTARVRSSSGMTGRIRAHGRKPAPRRWVDLHPQRAQPRTVSWSAIILSGKPVRRALSGHAAARCQSLCDRPASGSQVPV